MRNSLFWMAAIAAIFLLGTSAAAATSARLNQDEIATQIQQLPGWRTDGDRLYCTYEFENFVEAIAFVNQLVQPAEAAGHHPDIAIAYNQVRLSLTTHDAGGLTAQDFALAQDIARLNRAETRCLTSP